MDREHLQIGRHRELLADPLVVTAPDLALVLVGFAGIHPDDPDPFHVDRPCPRADQVLEVHVPDVARIVVPGDRVEGRVDAVGVRDPALVLLSEPLAREVAGHDDGVGPQLVQLGDHPVHQVRDEVRRTDVWSTEMWAIVTTMVPV